MFFVFVFVWRRCGAATQPTHCNLLSSLTHSLYPNSTASNNVAHGVMAPRGEPDRERERKAIEGEGRLGIESAEGKCVFFCEAPSYFSLSFSPSSSSSFSLLPLLMALMQVL